MSSCTGSRVNCFVLRIPVADTGPHSLRYDISSTWWQRDPVVVQPQNV